jgi:hypothetical protein
MLANDADLVEVNPLAIVRETAADGPSGRATGLPRRQDHPRRLGPLPPPRLEALRDLDEEDPADAAAREDGINFIKLDGSIGCMVNGAGLAMTTMDLVKRAGGEPANFLDIGGGARADKVAAAMGLILADPQVTAILVNIFGGITRGDEVARGLIEARAVQARDVPMVVRIVGTNAAEAADCSRPTTSRPRPASTTPRPRRSPPLAGRGRRGRVPADEHPRRARHPPGRPGDHRARGRVPLPGDARVRHPDGGRGDPQQGRPARSTAACRSSTRSPTAVRETGANTSCIYVPAAGAPDAILEAAGAGIATIFCITEASRPWTCSRRSRSSGRRRPADRPELPRRDVAGPGQGRDHPGLRPSRGRGRGRVPLGHADLRGRPGDERRRDRPVHLRRDRRRPDHRHHLPRRPPAVRGGSRDRRDRPDRRDRRLGRGGGRGLGRRAPPGRADGRLHRRADGARRQADGPRRGDHLGRLGHGRRQDRGPRGGRDPGRRLADRDPGSSSAPPATGAELDEHAVAALRVEERDRSLGTRPGQRVDERRRRRRRAASVSL